MPTTHHDSKRPRTAVIGFGAAAVNSLAPLFGEARPADTWEDYINQYSLAETDLIVTTISSNGLLYYTKDLNIHCIIISSDAEATWGNGSTVLGWRRSDNVERQLISHNTACNSAFDSEVDILARQYQATPPRALRIISGYTVPLLTTSGGTPVAAMYQPLRGTAEFDAAHSSYLLLPVEADLRSWCLGWLKFLHTIAPERVPTPPPEISAPEHWFTPEESRLSGEVELARTQVLDAQASVESLSRALSEESRRADEHERAVLWADDSDLVAGVSVLLRDFGFDVHDVDSERPLGEAKREDLRIIDPADGWITIGEVKAYSRGARTNDLRQVREQRDLFVAEVGSLPNATWWIVNDHRGTDPGDRPKLNNDVDDKAGVAGVVALSVPDLFQLWLDVAHDRLDTAIARSVLRSAQPGVWRR